MHYVLNFSIYILTGSILLESYNGSKPFKSEILQFQDREHDFSDWLFQLQSHYDFFYSSALHRWKDSVSFHQKGKGNL